MCATSEFFLLAIVFPQESLRCGEEVWAFHRDLSRWQQLSSTLGAVVMDAGEGMCRRFEPSNLENWGNRRQGCCPSPVKKICHFNTRVAASLFTSGRCPGIFCSTSRLLQFMFQRHSDFLTTKPASWKVVLTSQWKDQVLLWHLLKPLFVALIVCK